MVLHVAGGGMCESAMSDEFTGLNDLRLWLESQGFRCAEDGLRSRENLCNWYAWRRSALPTRACELNGPRAQIVINPGRYNYVDRLHETVEVALTGEAINGIWFKLQAYAPEPNQLMARLGDIENALVAAWNALDKEE